MAVADIMHGPVKLYRAPVGTTPPADTVAVDGTWIGWTAFGYTKEALTSNYEFDEQEIKVQQALTAVERFKSAENLTLKTTLAELTPANMQITTSGTATTTPADTGQPPKDELVVGGESVIDKYAWGFEGTYTDSAGATFPIRLFVWKGTAKMAGEQEHGQEGYVGIPIEVKALADLSKAVGQQLYKFQRILGAAE